MPYSRNKISVGNQWIDVNNYSDEDLQDLIDELRDSIDSIEREMESRREDEK